MDESGQAFNITILSEMSPSNHTATFLSSKDVDFQSLIDRHVQLPLPDHIPKVAHFILSRVKELTWLQYACIRGALTNMGMERVKIWISSDTKILEGDIWRRIEDMEGVEIVRIVIPNQVFGKTVQHMEHESDLARIKILYEEGGIYMDTDVLALKSSDEVIFNARTKATVMPAQNPGYSHVVSNAMIMSKPGSPFLRRWMQKYKNFDPQEWDHTSCQVPMQMSDAGDPDLTVLPYQSWMYPMNFGAADVGRDPHLATQWLGKSWFDIEKSFGAHLWKFDAGRLPRPVIVTPDTVRTVDTPMFCRIRPIFDNLDGDGYMSVPWHEDPNCWPSYVKDLRPKNFRKFGDWRFSKDEHEMKWIDSSGYGNHGFAYLGNNVTTDPETGVAKRRFDEGSHAWLPVPADWDARVGTVRMSFTVDEHAWLDRDGKIGLFKIRIDYGGEIALSLESHELYDAPFLKFEWHGNFLANDDYKHLDDVVWQSSRGLNLSLTSPNDLAITYDRRTEGSISAYLNGDRVAKNKLKLITSPKIGNEVWINAREWKDIDTGFRGNLYGMSMYADVVPGPELVGYANGSFGFAQSGANRLSMLFCLLLLSLILASWAWRARLAKGLRNDFTTLARSFSSHLRSAWFNKRSWTSDNPSYNQLQPSPDLATRDEVEHQSEMCGV